MRVSRSPWRSGSNARRRKRYAVGVLESLEGRALMTSAAFAVTSDWGTGFGGQVTITNTQSTPINDWTLSFDWDRSITQIWDGVISSHTGNEYTITNAGWNSTIAPGGSAEFGFNGASGNVGTDVPTDYVLNGVALGTPAAAMLSIGNVTVNDGTAGASALFTVTLSEAESTAVTVGYATSNGTAVAGTNYTAESGTLTFSPGTLSQTISVPITADTTAKGNLTFGVNLTNPVGASLGTSSGTGTIVDTVSPTPTPTPAPTPTPTPTPTTTAVASFEVTSDWGSGFGGQMTISNPGSTAINNWTLSFQWDRSITSIWDATISSHSGNSYTIVGAAYDATIAAGASVSFGFDGSTGNVGTDVPTSYALNGVVLGAAVPSINVTNVSVNDGTAGNTELFTVTLSQASTKTITVAYATANGTAIAGTDYTAKSGTLTFAPGALSETVSVPINADTAPKATLSYLLTLSNPVNAALATTSATGTIVDIYGTPAPPPVANNVSTTTLEGTPLTVNTLADSSDPNGYTISLASYTQPAHGTVTANPTTGVLTYTPAANYLGADSFTYTVSDGHGETATGTVSLLVVTDASPGTWPAHVFAPYVDMTLYPTYNLTTAMSSAGIKYFTLAFITADSNNLPAWGGYSSYEVNGGTFDQSIRTEISQVRSLGGDVSVSFGGEAGTELAQAITSVSALTAAYQTVITAYNLTHIDFDIEGGAVADNASIDRRSQALASLQATAAAAGKTLDVSFTLPVLPTGLTSNGLYVLQSALKYGVKISTVNVMAMDYGDSAAPNPAGQMGTYAIDAAQSTYSQLSTLYGTSLTSSQLWEMVGVTPLIGVNDVSDEVFEPSDATQLLAFAEKVGLGEIAFWSLARDQEDPKGALTYSEDDSSSIVQTPFEFSDIFVKFTNYP